MSRFFFPSPTPIFIFFSLWGSSRVFVSPSSRVFFGGVMVGWDPQMSCGSAQRHTQQTHTETIDDLGQLA